MRLCLNELHCVVQIVCALVIRQSYSKQCAAVQRTSHLQIGEGVLGFRVEHLGVLVDGRNDRVLLHHLP